MPRSAAFAALLAMLAACAPGPGTPGVTPAPPADPCVLTAGQGGDTGAVRTPSSISGAIVITLAQPVEAAHAPEPRHDAERIVFRHLYETLVRVDCAGRVLPGLAASWEVEGDAGGRVWRFTLSSEARFWDGAPVTAADVAAAWSARARRDATARGAGFGDGGSSDVDLVTVVPESVTVVNDTILIVALAEAGPAAEPRGAVEPVAFALPGLAVTKPSSATPWPIGTGAYWPVDDGSAAALVVARPVAGRGGAGTNAAGRIGDRRPIHFVGPLADPRDVLDRGADLLITDDRATLAYGATLPDYTAVPLPWDRTYVLALSQAGTLVADETPEARAALARDAVRRDARGAEPPFWWRELVSCGAADRSGPSDSASAAGDRSGQARGDSGARPAIPSIGPAPTARIVYPADDPTARELAERLVALAGRDPGEWPVTPVLEGPLVAVGLDAESFAAALAGGRDPAYLLSLPRRLLAPCAALERLQALVPWLVADQNGTLPLIALIDTRRHALMKTSAPPMRVDWDGTPVVVAAARPVP